MENELITVFIENVNKAIMNGTEIYATISAGGSNMSKTCVPCSLIEDNHGIYIESDDDNAITIECIDEIFYDEMEEMYSIKANNVNWYINFN